MFNFVFIIVSVDSQSSLCYGPSAGKVITQVGNPVYKWTTHKAYRIWESSKGCLWVMNVVQFWMCLIVNFILSGTCTPGLLINIYRLIDVHEWILKCLQIFRNYFQEFVKRVSDDRLIFLFDILNSPHMHLYIYIYTTISIPKHYGWHNNWNDIFLNRFVTHCVLVAPYAVGDLCQHWFR